MLDVGPVAALLISATKGRPERKSIVHHGGTETRRRPTHAVDTGDSSHFSVPPCLRASVVKPSSCPRLGHAHPGRQNEKCWPGGVPVAEFKTYANDKGAGHAYNNPNS